MIRLLLILLSVSLTALCQEKVSSIKIVTPKTWGKEIIQLPPSFAPDMKYRGIEDIRFAPGMFKPESSSFFTYVFLLDGKCGDKLDKKTVETEIMAYYKGLAKAVGGKKFKIDTDAFKIDLKSTVDSEYKGTLDWIEPFKTGKKQILNLKIFTWQSKEKHFLFAMVSPAKEESKIWKTLAEIKASLIIK